MCNKRKHWIARGFGVQDVVLGVLGDAVAGVDRGALEHVLAQRPAAEQHAAEYAFWRECAVPNPIRPPPPVRPPPPPVATVSAATGDSDRTYQAYI